MSDGRDGAIVHGHGRCQPSVRKKHRINQGQLPDPIASKQGRGECHWTTPIMAHEIEVLHAAGVEQLDYIACDGSVVIAVGGTRTIPSLLGLAMTQYFESFGITCRQLCEVWGHPWSRTTTSPSPSSR